MTNLLTSPCLFLGFQVDPGYEKKLKTIRPAVKSLFINDNPSIQTDYLLKVSKNKTPFLGKMINQPIDILTLELLEANIYSILDKLVPDYDYKSFPLLVFALDIV